jgi:hypothetical protein
MFKLLRDFAVDEIFSYESLNARKEEKSSTDELPTRFAVEFFLSYESLKSRKRRIFLPTSYIQGKYGKAMEALESARADLSPQEGDVKKKRKEKDKEGKKVAPAKARFRVA